MKKIITLLIITILSLGVFTACDSDGDTNDTTTSGTTQSTTENTDDDGTDDQTTTAADNTGTETVEIKGIVDLVPHSELVAYVTDKLAEEGVIVNIVSNAADSTTNERTVAGEIDFNFHQHYPYLSEWNSINGGNLVNAGDIHVEPISAYSDDYSSISEIPDNAKIAIPNDATNEYRALRILELEGFIVLKDSANQNLSASVTDIEEYLKPIELIELDSAVIIPTKDDFDVFITNVNKALEAGITSNVLFKEGDDSPYANIVAVRDDLDADKRAAVDKLVAALQSDDTRNYILETYDGKVIPAVLS